MPNGKRVNVQEIIAQKLETYKVLVAAQEGEISYPPYALKSEISADPIHFSNMVDNLLDNSLKYCDGPPVITIESYIMGHGILKRFTDRGIGMIKKILPSYLKSFSGYPKETCTRQRVSDLA